MEVIDGGSQVEATKWHITVKLTNFQGEMALNEALYNYYMYCYYYYYYYYGQLQCNKMLGHRPFIVFISNFKPTVVWVGFKHTDCYVGA